MGQVAKVSVFCEGDYVGSLTQQHFSTNGDRPAIQNGSIAGFCPYCGDIWLRAVHNTGLDYWRQVTIPCLKHAGERNDHSFLWSNPAHILPDISDASVEVLLLEFLWWCKHRGNNLLGE